MNIENIFIAIFFLWHFKNYGPITNFYVLLQKMYFLLQEYYEKLQQDNNKQLEKDIKSVEEPIIQKKKEIKYEDKYLEEIRKMSKEYQFTEEENLLKQKKFDEVFNSLLKKYQEKLAECIAKIKNLFLKIEEYRNTDDVFCLINESDEEDDMDLSLCVTKEDIITKLEKELELVGDEEVEYRMLLETDNEYSEIKKEANEIVYEFMVQERLNKLNGCYIMEHTPQGNVIMTYDLSRNSFKYYSDSSIPYRYLETVARKYIKQFNCRPIFVDMEEELKLTEEKWTLEREKEEKEKAEKERLKQELEKNKNIKPVEEKKNVFAKFKSYNKEAGTGKINAGAAPPKNSIPNQTLNEKQANEKILLKEKANRYTYEGKMVNFSFLKKVNKKAVNKKYAMSFADFKKMQKEKI